MGNTRKLRSGKTYGDFDWRAELKDARVFTVDVESCPSLEALLVRALDNETKSPDEELEAFDDGGQENSADPISETTTAAEETTTTPTKNDRKRDAPNPDGKKFNPRHAKRRCRRAAEFEASGHLHANRSDALDSCQPYPTDVDVEDLRAAAGGFVGVDAEYVGAKNIHTPLWLHENGFRYVEWEGNYAIPIVDSKNRLFAVAVKRIKEVGYQRAVEEACAALEKARADTTFEPKEKEHKRGGFPAAAFGWSIGQGQKRPTHTAGLRKDLMQKLVELPCFQRIAAAQDAAFAYWSPKNYVYYKKSMDELKQRIPHFKLNFDRSIFACITLNFGPRTCTYIHTDTKNAVHGMCAITSGGSYDHKKGGHLILWDLKLVIEFPPGCTILIPSALLRHSNTPVQDGETRYSITQYTAGGIFRWLEYDGNTEKQLVQKRKRALLKRLFDERGKRWAKMVDMFSTLDELRKDL